MSGPYLFDRVKETTSTTGTGTLTLAGAVSGFRAFSVIGDGNTCYYAIVHRTAAEWEVGIGTYTLSGTTLARTTILASSNSGNAVNFSAGTKDVFVTAPASILGRQSLFTFSDITAINFSAVNGGGTFTSQTFGTVPGYILSTVSEIFNVRGREINAPSTPYSITVGMIPQFNGSGSGTGHNPVAGLFFRESSSDKYHAFDLVTVNEGSGGLLLQSVKFTNSTTFGVGYTGFDIPVAALPYFGGLIWLRIADNGTNRICSWSTDGVTFAQFHSISRTDFLTADKVGLFVVANSNSRSISAAFVSWLQS